LAGVKGGRKSTNSPYRATTKSSTSALLSPATSRSRTKRRRSRAISAIDCPPWRTEAASVEKSCTAPMKTTPKAIQARHGPQPNAWQARIGPAIGPAAAIAEKCWPNR